MRIPVPFEFRGGVVTEATFKKPTAGAIADTKRHADAGDVFLALATFVAAGTAELRGDDGKVFNEKGDLAGASRAMPYATANWASIQVLLGLGHDDTIEANNACPRCGKPARPGPDEKIGNLEVRVVAPGQRVKVKFKTPVEIKDQEDKVLTRVESLTLHYPTIDDCSKATANADEDDAGRSQFAVYVQAIDEVNGKPVDGQWKFSRGMMVMEQMQMEDMTELTRAVDYPGYVTTVPRLCRHCKKRWQAAVDVSGFFASGLLAG